MGFTTRKLAARSVGDSIEHILGPLGHPTEVKNLGRIVCIGGGEFIGTEINQKKADSVNNMFFEPGWSETARVIAGDALQTLADIKEDGVCCSLTAGRIPT